MPITPVYTDLLSSNNGSVKQFTWALTTAVPDGVPMEWIEWADRTWQAVGAFGGATVSIQGSNDGTNWFSLTNAAGGAVVSFTAAGGAATIELPRYVRPNLTVVGSGAAITVIVVARRANPMRA
jgi:hypothetical protein